MNVNFGATYRIQPDVGGKGPDDVDYIQDSLIQQVSDHLKQQEFKGCGVSGDVVAFSNTETGEITLAADDFYDQEVRSVVDRFFGSFLDKPLKFSFQTAKED